MTEVRRRFGLFDAIVLLVPTALAVGTLCRGPDLLTFLRRNGNVSYNLGDWWQALEFGLIIGGLGLAGFTVALLVLRLRRPRPARLRLWRQPGAAALLGAASVLGVVTFGSAVLLGIAGWPSIDDLIWNHSAPLLQIPGAAVLGVWIMLAASGRWKAERSWIDRSGRAAGVAWVLLLILSLGLHYRNEVESFLPFSQWVVRMAARQEQQRQLLERHEERQRSRLARFDDLHALREYFMAEQSPAQVEAVDRLLEEWHAREEREINEEKQDLEMFRGGSQTSKGQP